MERVDPSEVVMRTTGLGALASCIVMVIMMCTGCGPVGATQRIHQAEMAMERARVADAQERAPYEYTSAKEFLHKAKEEWGYSDFQAAKDYATEAKRSADAALLKAKEDPFTGSPVPADKVAQALREGKSDIKPRLKKTSSDGKSSIKDPSKMLDEKAKVEDDDEEDPMDVMESPDKADDDE